MNCTTIDERSMGGGSKMTGRGSNAECRGLGLRAEVSLLFETGSRGPTVEFLPDSYAKRWSSDVSSTITRVVGGPTTGRRIASIDSHSMFGGATNCVLGALELDVLREVMAMAFRNDERRALSRGSSSDKGCVRARGRDGDSNGVGGVGGDDSWVGLFEG